MIKNLILILFLIICYNYANANELVNVDNLYIETEKTFLTNRGYYIPEGEEPRYNFNLGFTLSSGFMYVDNVISSTVGDSQFRYVALNVELGINVTSSTQVYYRHYSGHMLDYQSTDQFPEENVIGLRFNLIGK